MYKKLEEVEKEVLKNKYSSIGLNRIETERRLYEIEKEMVISNISGVPIISH